MTAREQRTGRYHKSFAKAERSWRTHVKLLKLLPVSAPSFPEHKPNVKPRKIKDINAATTSMMPPGEGSADTGRLRGPMPLQRVFPSLVDERIPPIYSKGH